MTRDSWAQFIILVMVLGTVVLLLSAPSETKIVFWGILVILTAYVGVVTKIES